VDVEQKLETGQVTEHTVEQMLLLAERLRESHGGELDDEAIVAVSEATGAPVDYVRIAVSRSSKTKDQTITRKLRGKYLSLGPEERAWVMAGAVGAGAGMAYAFDAKFPQNNGLPMILMILLLVVGFSIIGMRKDSRVATIAGAILGCVGVVSSSLFGLFLGHSSRGDPIYVVLLTVLSAFLGFAIQKVVSRNRTSLGMKDPTEERQDLLRQLNDLRAKLESGKQRLTFLSVDIVGSTRMKAGADPLSVEYTFNEYHRHVERGTTKHGGTVHSTAGDGATCAFDSPMAAWLAAKYIQTGIIEVNTFGNKIGTPILLRCGIHCGDVVAPDVNDVTSVNFAHVIDVAAHLQKVCPEGGIAVSRHAAFEIPGGPSKIGSEQVEVDGEIGYVWLPRTRASLAATGGPPPLPEQA